MPLAIPPSLQRTLLHAGGGAAAGAALGGLTSESGHRLHGAMQGGAIGGLAAGGASALANHSAGQRINGLKGEVANITKNHEQAQMALRGAQGIHNELSTANSQLSNRLYEADTRIARLTGKPSNPVTRMPMTPVPAAPQSGPPPTPTQVTPTPTPPAQFSPEHANTLVDHSLSIAMAPTLSASMAPTGRQAMLPPPPLPQQQVKAAMSPLGGALTGAVTGGMIGGGASALSGERDPKNLARNAGLGAAVGGCAGFGIAHNAGKCEHARGKAIGYEQGYGDRSSVNEEIGKALNAAGAKLQVPLDVLRGLL